MTTEHDYGKFALDSAVAVIGAAAVGYAVVQVAGMFGVPIALGTPAVATAAFTTGIIAGAVGGLIAALRWPERAVAIHDGLVPERDN